MGCASSSTASAVDPPVNVLVPANANVKIEVANPLSVVSQNSSISATSSSPNSNPHQPSSHVKTTDAVTVVAESVTATTTPSTDSVSPPPPTATTAPSPVTIDSETPSSSSSITFVTAEASPKKEAVNVNVVSATLEASPSVASAAASADVVDEKEQVKIKTPAVSSIVEKSDDVVFSEVQAELEEMRELREDVAEALREMELADIHDRFEDVNEKETTVVKSDEGGNKKEGEKNPSEIMAMSAALVELMELEEAAGEDVIADEEEVEQEEVEPKHAFSTTSSTSIINEMAPVSETALASSSSATAEASDVQTASPPLPPPTISVSTNVQSQELHTSTGASKSDPSVTSAPPLVTPTKMSLKDVLVNNNNNDVNQHELASPPRPSVSSSQQQLSDAIPSTPPSTTSSFPSSSLSSSPSTTGTSPSSTIPIPLTSRALGSPGSRAEAVMKALNSRQPLPSEVKTAIDRSHALSTVHFMRFGRGDKAFLEGQLQIVTDSLSTSSSSLEAITSSVYHLNGLPEIFVGLVVAQAFKHLAIEIAALVASGRATFENSLPYAFIDLQQRISDPKSASQACQSAERGAVNCMISVFPYSVGSASERASESKPRTLQTQLIADMSRRLQDVKTEANSSDFVKYRDVLMTMVNNCSSSYESRVVKTSPEPQSVAMRSKLVEQIISLSTVPPETDIPSSPSPRLPIVYLPMLKTSTSAALSSVLYCFASDHTESRRSIIHKTMASLFNKGTGLCINIVGERVVTVWKKQVEAKIAMGVSSLTKQTATKIPIDNVEIERIVKTIRMDLESFEAQQIETLYPIKLSPHADDEMMLAFPDGQKLLVQLKAIIAEAIRTKLERVASSAKAAFQLHAENSPAKARK